MPDAAALAYGRPPRPCCPVHGVEMDPYGQDAQKIIRYWKCPVAGCRKTGQDLVKYQLKRPRRL